MLLIVLASCAPPEPEPDAPVSLVLPARFTAEEHGITWEEAEAGLAWSLSNLGALPPADGWLTVTESERDTTFFELDLEAAGFDDRAVPALTAAVVPLWESDELAELGSVDVGRLLMRTLYAPWRYYSITGACDDIAGWQESAEAGNVENYGVTMSLLTKADRLITLNAPPWSDTAAIAFSTRSGDGVLTDPEVSEEVEVIDLMANGQQRYAVYDADGLLAPAADPAIISAGQPGKCMWCHEGGLMTGTPANPTSRPHLSSLEWRARMAQMKGMLDEHRAGLDTAVNFTTYEIHGYGERIVREFLYPTPQHLQQEWGISGEAMDLLLEEYGVERTIDHEYSARGEVVSRVAVDAIYAAEFAPLGFVPLAILPDDREAPEDFSGLEGEADQQALPGCWRP